MEFWSVESPNKRDLDQWRSWRFEFFPSIKTSNVDPKEKGKSIQVDQTEEEKKRLQAIEIKRQRKINNISRQRANDPPGVNKGDPNKQWCYETIEIVFLGKNDDFMKKTKKSYDVENLEFN